MSRFAPVEAPALSPVKNRPGNILCYPFTGPKPQASATTLATLFALTVFCVSCGYRTVGNKSPDLPAGLHSIAIPAFKNGSQVYHVEQLLTEAVVREFMLRTQYRVLNGDNGTADAVLRGAILDARIAPITFDSRTGQASTAQVTITVRASLSDRSGKILWENPSYVFREQYELSLDAASFFQEETPAERRMAQDFAATLISNILEAY